MTRVETFVDAAFAFAVTMLVLNTEKVPESLPELVEALKGLPSFLASFATMALFWLSHRDYTQRFRTEDGRSVFLSMVLIAIMLVFIYPLKFAFTQGFGYFFPILRTDGFVNGIRTIRDLAWMFVIYGAGFVAFHVVMVLLLRGGIARTRDLDPVARAEARGQIESHLTGIGTGCLSIVLAAIAWRASTMWVAMLPGFTYCLLGVLMPWVGRRTERMVRAARGG